MPSDLEIKATKVASRSNFMNIFGDVRVGDQLDLSVIETDAGEGDGGSGGAAPEGLRPVLGFWCFIHPL